MVSARAMRRYAAFLRGINVGGQRIKMGELREMLRPLELTSVETFIASGNVIFDCETDDATSLEGRIGAHLHDRLGYQVDTFIRPVGELGEVIAFGRAQVAGDPELRVHVMFVKTEPVEDSRGRFRELESSDDLFRFRGREIYWLRRGGLSETSITMADLKRALGGASYTSRTIRTIERIRDRFGEERS